MTTGMQACLLDTRDSRRKQPQVILAHAEYNTMYPITGQSLCFRVIKDFFNYLSN